MSNEPVIENPHGATIKERKRLPLARIALVSAFVLGILCIGLWGLVFRNLNDSAKNENNLTCQQLVEQATVGLERYCQEIGTNQLCYGNFSVEVELAQGISQKFSERGDIIDVDSLRRLSAAPLDLADQTWGIAVFKVTANLPRSLPGQTVTVLVFGNTTLDKDGPGLHTFYFFSDTGQVICDEVPFDGLFISMPDGTGVRFNINGAELVLTGTASITANLGGEMNISLYEGSAQVTANGQTQVFGPGQQVSIPLGGENGMESVGPPSEPTPLSEEELILACTITGENCENKPIPTVSTQELQITLTSEAGGTSTAVVTNTLASPSRTPANTATVLPSPTFFPTATFAPPHTATFLPTWTATKKPTDPPEPTDMPTNTPIPPTNTPICDHINAGAINFADEQLSISITNNNSEPIRLSQLTANWVDSPESQSVTSITLDGTTIWTGSAPDTPSTHIFSGAPGLRQIGSGQTETLLLNFSENLATGSYDLLVTFEGGCTVYQSGARP